MSLVFSSADGQASRPGSGTLGFWNDVQGDGPAMPALPGGLLVPDTVILDILLDASKYAESTLWSRLGPRCTEDA